MAAFLFPEKKSPIEGVPVIPGGTLWGGHLHLLREPDFRVALHKWTVEHADENGRCTFWMGPATPSLSVTHPEDVQILLKGTAYRSTFAIMNQHFIQLFGSHNVGLLNGKEWKQQRAKIAKALHSSQVVASHEQAFRETTERLVKQLLLEITKEDESFFPCDDILLLMKSLTLDCFGQAAFHTDFGSCQSFLAGGENATEASQIGPAFDRLTKDMMRRVTTNVLHPSSHIYSLPTTTNNEYAKDKEMVLGFLRKLIQERQADNHNASKPPPDLLTGFLEHFETDDMDQDSILIIAQSIMGLLFAGYETTSVTLTYALYLLSQNPKVMGRCLEEILADTTQDAYLEAVVKETLRLYPPAISSNRTSDRELELPSRNGSGKILVPQGTYLYVSIWTIQRDPDNYDNPLEFLPERWVEPAEGTTSWKVKSTVPDNAWIPFSAGARACPGQHFAMQETTTILSVLLPALHFAPPEDYVLCPHRDGFIQVPKGGIPMKISPRKG